MKRYFLGLIFITIALNTLGQALSEKTITGNWSIKKVVWLYQTPQEKKEFPRFESFFLMSRVVFDSSNKVNFITDSKDAEMKKNFSLNEFKNLRWYFDSTKQIISIYDIKKLKEKELLIEIEVLQKDSLVLFHLKETPMMFFMERKIL